MVRGRGRGGGRKRPPQKGAPAGRGGQKGAAATKPARKPAKVVFDAPKPAPEEPRTFRLGAIPGATPGKWIDIWKQRMPHVELELVPVAVAAQRTALADLDAALVRLPIDDPDELHVIRLYDEVPVVIASTESHLLAADELTADDLAGEVLITPDDDVFGPLDLPTVAPCFGTVPTTADAVATAASGVGIVVVPMSLARLHHRKDVDHRALRDGPTSTAALVWPRDRTTADVEAFVGIVRGRTANSSR